MAFVDCAAVASVCCSDCASVRMKNEKEEKKKLRVMGLKKWIKVLERERKDELEVSVFPA